MYYRTNTSLPRGIILVNKLTDKQHCINITELEIQLLKSVQTNVRAKSRLLGHFQVLYCHNMSDT